MVDAAVAARPGITAWLGLEVPGGAVALGVLGPTDHERVAGLALEVAFRTGVAIRAAAEPDLGAITVHVLDDRPGVHELAVALVGLDLELDPVQGGGTGRPALGDQGIRRLRDGDGGRRSRGGWRGSGGRGPAPVEGHP